MSTLAVRWIPLREARLFVGRHHRHHRAPSGCVFCLGAFAGDSLVGVAVVGRPLARMIDDGQTFEVTRLCTLEGRRGDHANSTASLLLSRCRRVGQAMGVRRLVSYVLASERGTCYLADGWRDAGVAGGGKWSRAGRPRADRDLFGETRPLGPKRRMEAP